MGTEVYLFGGPYDGTIFVFRNPRLPVVYFENSDPNRKREYITKKLAYRIESLGIQGDFWVGAIDQGVLSKAEFTLTLSLVLIMLFSC